MRGNLHEVEASRTSGGEAKCLSCPVWHGEVALDGMKDKMKWNGAFFCRCLSAHITVEYWDFETFFYRERNRIGSEVLDTWITTTEYFVDLSNYFRRDGIRHYRRVVWMRGSFNTFFLAQITSFHGWNLRVSPKRNLNTIKFVHLCVKEFLVNLA